MIRIRALIELYLEGGRKTAFISGYRPSFLFTEIMHTSGMIELIDSTEFYPGEKGEVMITLLYHHLLGDDFEVGKKFTFCEVPTKPIGEGTVLEIVQDEADIYYEAIKG